jgi:hypothetical protein
MSDDTLRGQLHSAAAAPSEPLDWPHTLERGLRRRKRRRAVPAVLTGAVVVAAAIAVPLVVASRAPAGQVLHGTPVAPSWEGQANPALHVPSGWRAVTYGDVQIAVPADWQVVDTAAKSCEATAGTPAVVLGTPPSGGIPCPATTRYLVWARPASANAPRTGAAVTVDGVSVAAVEGATSPIVQGTPVTYLVPAFGVELTVASAWAHSVIATLSPSARFVVARPGLLPYTPAQWRLVGLGGVSLRVPPTWPVVHRGPLLIDDLAPWTSSEANLGSSPRDYSEHSSVQHLVPGVWLFASDGKPPASWGDVVGDFPVSGGTVQVFAGDPAATWVPVLVTPSGFGTPIGLWLGVGSDGVIARDILASLEVTGQ